MASHILQVGGGAGLPAGEAQQLRKMLEPFSPAAVEARLPALPRALTERLASEFAQAEAGLAIGGGAAVHDARATQTQMAINLLNYVAGAVGRTVRFDQPLRTPATAGGAAIRALAEKMKGGEIDILFLHHA